MASSVPLQVAETVQTAHLNPEPASEHDINPSTAASKRVPATFEEYPLGDFHDDSIDEDERDGRRAEGDESIPYSVVRPKRRSSHLPPLPDLRFEQSYLHSISQTTSWQGLAWITVRDQVLMPFVQGILYNLVLCGWQYWNRSARLSGNSVGAKVRRWWWDVNNWHIPGNKPRVAR